MGSKFYLILFIGSILFSCNSESSKNAKKHVLKKNIIENKVICKEEEKPNTEFPDSPDPLIIKSCTWGKYKIISTGSADFKGRYSYECQSYEKVNNTYKEIENSAMFNKVNKVEEMVNTKLEAEFDKIMKENSDDECLEVASFKPVSVNDMYITFLEKNFIEFNISLALGGYCYGVDEVSVKIPLSELKPYFK